MPNNLHTTFKKGEVGKVLEFTLSDAAGLYNLDGWTVTLTIAERASAEPVLSNLAVTKKDQSANLGQCYHTLTSTSANIDPKVYKACELKLVNGAQVRYWPVDRRNEKTYFVIDVKKAVG